MKITITYFIILIFVAVFSSVEAESFDSEAISQVSKEIAEWKLMNEDKGETQHEQRVYVSSSLRGMVEEGSGEGVGVVTGLAAFDDDGQIESEIRNWELDAGYKASNTYISRLPTNPWQDILTSAGGELTRRGIGSIYGRKNFGLFKIPPFGQCYNDIANIYRSAGAMSANRIADTYIQLGYSPNPLGDIYRLSDGGIYTPNYVGWINEGNKYRGIATRLSYPTNDALFNTARGLRIYETAETIMGSTIHAADTFLKTVDYAGTAMQIMNPPIYLQNNPKFNKSPGVSTWEGSGSYRIPSGVVNYQETLEISGQGYIKQTHNDWVTTNTGTEYRHVEIKTPASSGFERWVFIRYPLGSYWDPQSSTTYTITRSQQSYCRETRGGISNTAPLPNIYSKISPVYSTVDWNAIKQSSPISGNYALKTPQIDWTNVPRSGIGNGVGNWGSGMGKWNTGVGMGTGGSNYPPPNILFSTKPPSYSPYSISKIPDYPSIPPPSLGMPSSSWGRKY